MGRQVRESQKGLPYCLRKVAPVVQGPSAGQVGDEHRENAVRVPKDGRRHRPTQQ